MLNTGAIACNTEYLMGLECLVDSRAVLVPGRVWLELPGRRLGHHLRAPARPDYARPQNYVFSGGYLQVAYTLTGEYRAYDKRVGTLAREYFGKAGPTSKFFIIRDDCGNIISSWAREVAASLLAT